MRTQYGVAGCSSPWRPKLAFRSAIGVLVILFACTYIQRARASDDRCGSKSERDRKELQLRATVTELLSLLKSGNAPALMKHIDEKGIYIWGGLLSPDDIKNEIAHKNGIYCLLFSTECLRAAKLPNGAYINYSKWTISYSEWLKRHSPTSTEVEMFYDGEGSPCHANVAVRSQKNPSPDQLTFELGFDYRGEFWKLSGTPAWPEGIASRVRPTESSESELRQT